ncbi:hypothetical protein [Jiella pelagia]|uniref:Uncharacterized protein n=1 Tax=Jiella pelagia TaxID=2986949 RepID=A0ABY7BZW2_9HYPH|nr:hypothetical protein [Jiella pelagia]WAP69056.1 hypothetical protein OH818_01595 [Jiella pelagia]
MESKRIDLPGGYALVRTSFGWDIYHNKTRLNAYGYLSPNTGVRFAAAMNTRPPEDAKDAQPAVRQTDAEIARLREALAKAYDVLASIGSVTMTDARNHGPDYWLERCVTDAHKAAKEIEKFASAPALAALGEEGKCLTLAT